MAGIAESTAIQIPKLPSDGVKNFIPYLTRHPSTPISELIEPYKAFESELRKVYAQQPNHECVKDGNVNLVPIFDGHSSELKIRSRNLDAEDGEERSKYIMTLKDEDRKKDGTPAFVDSFKDFQNNFNLFSESSLTEMDWNNVVAAGSAVTTALLPVPEKWAESKRSLREYYHEHLAPASDVDLFIYGLNEEEGLQKIKQIERSINDSILHETTTIRTKNAITIASQYPTRHVQIVLRLYNSISQIITGFDVDCACVAYTGNQVYAAPRAVTAFLTQCNTIDLTRRSPSYENRLSKYSHRGFEVHWPLLNRSRIDPTIFERSFGRTQGLARLLVLEKLPKAVDRDRYTDQRREERGRPALNRGYLHGFKNPGNLKEQEEDEVAEWVEQEEVSSYHTMTVPYGPKYHASRINRLLYAKDLLLNAEWNQPEDREVYLHRHPCFFGTAEEVIQDCCGFCPVPRNEEEIKFSEEEQKTNVSGELKFLVEDPGRQEIGSFNPITDDEWTTMAYVGDTARLCQAIVDGDLEHVQDWCAQEGVDIDRRDYTGRTPLHLAVMASTPEIVQCLVVNGARLIARLVDGKTALHLAAARGDADMVKILMDKSLANEEEEDEKQMKAAKPRADSSEHDVKEIGEVDSESESESIDLGTEDTDSDTDSVTMGSFVRIGKDKTKSDESAIEESLDDPDVYDVNIVMWDFGLSPLHLAILNGHLHIIELLVSEYGADVLIPVKFVQPGTSNPRGAIMTLILAMSLPADKAMQVIHLLLKLGATSSQADMNHFTAFHHVISQNNDDVLDVLLKNDRPAALSVLNNLGYSDHYGSQLDSPLTTAIKKGHQDIASTLLKLGAKPEIGFDDWIKGYLAKNPHAKNSGPEQNLKQYHSIVTQPIIAAAVKNLGKIVEELIQNGADPSTLESSAWGIVEGSNRWSVGESLLDIIQKKLTTLRNYKAEKAQLTKPFKLYDENWYTQGITKSTYEYWTALRDYEKEKRDNKKAWKSYEKLLEEQKDDGYKEKVEAIAKVTEELENLEKSLLASGAKTFRELHPDSPDNKRNENFNYRYEPPKPTEYQTKISFQVPDLNPAKKIGYLRLFEASWNNDVETVKALTLAPWESKSGEALNPPLKIAVKDNNGFSPFSIATLRGHRELARRIVEVCIAQYHTDDGTKGQRWTTRQTDSDDEDCSNDDYSCDDEHEHRHRNSSELPIISELVNDKYTIDNLGEVSNVVKGDVLPLTMIQWECYANRFVDNAAASSQQTSILGHSVMINDLDLFKFIMQLGAEQMALQAEEEDDQKCYTVPLDVFYKAIAHGRTDMLAEMIRKTGAGIPLNELIKSSGVALKTKPKYYQGLSVGGKKRVDWAQAPGGNVQVAEERTPPLLRAAFNGNIESVEWFMSDAPMRRYKEFAEANKQDKRINTLQETGKGFNQTIGTWLNAKSELTLHCAVLYNSDKKSEAARHLALLKHLVSISPDSLEKKSSEGWTPLHAALIVQREDIVKYFISIGANQRTRDNAGRNILHTMVSYRHHAAKTDAKKLQAMLDLFDKPKFTEMFVERCSESPGALTPLAFWLSRNRGNYKKIDFLRVLCKYSAGEDLEMINGEGDLPLHVAVKKGNAKITAYILSLNPALLHRENATGRTPLEMARDIYTASHVAEPSSNSVNYHYYPNSSDDYESTARKPAADFAPPKPVDPEEEVGDEGSEATLKACLSVDEAFVSDTSASEAKPKRRLVSLFEANEVAKRLAGKERAARQVVINGYLVEDSKPDIVSEWLRD